MTKKNLVKFVRGKRNERVGVVVAICQDGVVETGWSRCNTKLGDKFDDERAVDIAVGRAKKADRIEKSRIKLVQAPKSLNTPKSAPSSMKKVIAEMRERGLKYFKGAKARK